MALSDLTDAQAVLDAVSEHDLIGRDAFLERYGFGRAVSYFLQWEDGFYDSKAIVGAAHGFQHGEPLRSEEFSGGEGIATLLKRLGFRVTRPGDWHFRVGDVTTRAEIQSHYGGATYGGIEPSTTSPNIFVFTDPASGMVNGYNFDGWDPEEPEVFHYTGAGRVGDQSTTYRGNKAILEHVDAGRAIRVFQAEAGPSVSGGKRQIYLGAFRLDRSDPYRLERAPDSQGTDRSVIVFQLRSDETGPNAGDPTAVSPAEDDNDAVQVEFVDSERNDIHEFETAPRTGSRSRREESALVTDFEVYLRKSGHEVGRLRINTPRGQGNLVTDTYDRTTATLYEAKSSANRATVRLGLGQVLDYKRYLEAEVECQLLLPGRPIDDLVEFLHFYRVGITWRDGAEWVTENLTDVEG